MLKCLATNDGSAHRSEVFYKTWQALVNRTHLRPYTPHTKAEAVCAATPR